jgi:hypothetical protein
MKPLFPEVREVDAFGANLPELTFFSFFWSIRVFYWPAPIFPDLRHSLWDGSRTWQRGGQDGKRKSLEVSPNYFPSADAVRLKEAR